jgi:hypothetical protein
MLPYLCSAFLRMDERTRVCPNCRSCTVYSLGFNRIQIHRSHIEGVHQSVNNNRIVTYIGPISFKMCLSPSTHYVLSQKTQLLALCISKPFKLLLCVV